ncbi:MAG: PKD domain-containing protein, partial [Methanoregulaceae archaeon]|nr:PKD domain-containing protein [Methanoregulaceae archaeon]
TGFLTGASVTLKKAGEYDIVALGVPTVVNSTKILCFFDLTNAGVGSWDVVVTNTDLQSGTLPDGFFISYPAAPQIISITPVSGVNTGMVAISSLTGTGLQNGVQVILQKAGQADINGTNVMVYPPTEITCEFNLAGAAEGLWDVMVVNDDGQSGVLPGGFQVRFPVPKISNITPAIGLNNGPVSITNLSGEYFRSPATVKLTRLGETDIPATGVAVVNAETITCSFALGGADTGPWNLVVTNPDGQYAIATDIFTVENPAPSVSKITPNIGPNDRTIFISALNGTGFLPGAMVQLTKNGLAPINATDVHLESATKINCTLNLTGMATGKWNVVVRNTDGKTGTLFNAFEITTPPPIPDFTANPVFGTAPLKVQFTDNSQNTPIIWSWNFGDGQSAVGFNLTSPVHTYNQPGVYNVTLLVKNTAGEEEVTKYNYITVVRTPVASFTAEPLSGPAPLLVQFTDTSDGDPLKWLWKFGDGGYSFEQNPYHLYKNPGIYTVTLTASNTAGSDTVTATNMIKVTSVPVAGFTSNITSGISPLAVQFKDISTGSPTAWLWKFGDGGSSTAQNPVHVYANSGTYSVQLFVSNDAGSSTETKEAYILVGQGLHADFEYATSNPENTAPLGVAFTDRSSGKVLKWTWRFGDGYVSNERNPIHNYPLPGTYEVTLSVTGLTGSDSMTKTITVNSPLKADFMVEPRTGSAPLTVMLSDISIGDVTDRVWSISKDPKNLSVVYAKDKNEIFTINEPGLYQVTLIVHDSYGATDSKSVANYINVLPFPE